MKKISSYLPSLLISIVLVFTFIGTAVIALTDININANSCISLAKKNALEKGLLILTAGKNVVRLLPPLTISEIEIKKGLAILLKCLS